MLRAPQWTCVFWLCCLLGTPSYAAEVIIYGDDDYPPIMYKDQQGQAQGVMTDAVRHFEEFSGKKVQQEPTSWRRAYEYATRGKGGIIGLSKTKERLAIFDYSDVIFEDNIYLAVRRGKTFDFKTLNDLKGKLIGVHLGASYGDSFDSAIKEGLFIADTSTTDVIRLRKLLRGRLDAAVVTHGQIGLDAILKTDAELLANKNEFVVLATPLVRDPLYLGFAKSMKMTTFLNEFNQSLKANKTPLMVKK
ncbi:transporter substrate-binding domain-containing protein [Deefgea tanakiae]|uniref:Transporter substrate-binding domain-containing protein n=1 Tax=Deefgea tanakiae TaxID=2865840 RepID=A0ABX8Z457_9NEIS|nr:transporter substrate-binding domain-containing protein [Deefgea tanakiae]QZA77368.1 transporter substrate-binding domain-containing protein [Deefgea tanakiae]